MVRKMKRVRFERFPPSATIAEGDEEIRVELLSTCFKCEVYVNDEFCSERWLRVGLDVDEEEFEELKCEYLIRSDKPL